MSNQVPLFCDVCDELIVGKAWFVVGYHVHVCGQVCYNIILTETNFDLGEEDGNSNKD